MHRARFVATVLAAAASMLVPLARAASPDAVISQVYAGGGNAGATYTNDFVELFNRGGAAVDLTGWTIQYSSAASTSWQLTTLAGTLAPGRHYLVQLGSTAAVGAALPAPDASGTTNLAASGGKVALVRNATALVCGAAAGSCSSAGAADLVGYGSAADFEGAGAAPALDSTTADVRANGGCTDTDVNAADFAAVAPAPKNGTAVAAPCGGTPPPTGGTGQTAVDLDVQPVLSLSLERTSVSFGQAVAGATPTPVSERVTVTSNDAAGYSLTVHRTAFTPGDLPLGLAASAPAGAQLGPSLGAGLVPIPVAPAADLLIGSAQAATAAGGAAWPATIGFAAPLPAVASGRYAATVTFTAIPR
jgi:hypothetical protein